MRTHTDGGLTDDAVLRLGRSVVEMGLTNAQTALEGSFIGHVGCVNDELVARWRILSSRRHRASNLKSVWSRSERSARPETELYTARSWEEIVHSVDIDLVEMALVRCGSWQVGSESTFVASSGCT